jgi:hypothetical protein
MIRPVSTPRFVHEHAHKDRLYTTWTDYQYAIKRIDLQLQRDLCETARHLLEELKAKLESEQAWLVPPVSR